MCEVVGIAVHLGPWRKVVKSREQAAILDRDDRTILVASEATASRIVTAVNAYTMLICDNAQMRGCLREVRTLLQRDHSKNSAIGDALCFIDLALSDDEQALEVCPL